MSASTHYQILEAVQAKIVALSLTGQDSTRISIRDTPVLTEEERNAGDWIVIVPFGAETNPGGTNARDEWQYPTLIAIVGRPNLQTLDARLYRRERIMVAFHNVNLTGITNGTFITQEVQPGGINDAAAFQDRRQFISILIHRCNVKKART